MNLPVVFYYLILIAMATVSYYLNGVYLDHLWNQVPTTSLLCQINDYFNCQKATSSPASNIFGVPIALLGLILSLLLLMTPFLKNKRVEGTNHMLIYANALGCLGLFGYSLFMIKGLCPFCFVYHLLSWSLAFLVYRYRPTQGFSYYALVLYGLLFALVSGIFLSYHQKKMEHIQATRSALYKEFHSYQKISDPALPSPYRLASSTENFADAPIRMSIFSDFQCPACRALAELIPIIKEQFLGKINIQYFSYPLDQHCNPEMKHPHNLFSCQAAYLASCLKDDFYRVHMDIFAAQKELTQEWINQYAQEHHVTECLNDPKNPEKIAPIIQMGNDLKIAATPTIILNGVKIEGVLPIEQLLMLIQEAENEGQNARPAD